MLKHRCINIESKELLLVDVFFHSVPMEMKFDEKYPLSSISDWCAGRARY